MAAVDARCYLHSATQYVVVCPFCGHDHFHGRAGGLGHRMSECNQGDGYELRLQPPDAPGHKAGVAFTPEELAAIEAP